MCSNVNLLHFSLTFSKLLKTREIIKKISLLFLAANQQLCIKVMDQKFVKTSKAPCMNT